MTIFACAIRARCGSTEFLKEMAMAAADVQKLISLRLLAMAASGTDIEPS